jgi:hypothetical protein
MSDNLFYTFFGFIFAAALILQCFVAYKIGVFGVMPRQRTIIIDNRSRKVHTNFCSIDDDDWKELKAEPV